MEAPISDPILMSALPSSNRIRVRAAQVGNPRRRNHRRGAEAIMARKMAINRGITMLLAAFRPAITITRQASTSSTCVPVLEF
jgi:hypothetical protein